MTAALSNSVVRKAAALAILMVLVLTLYATFVRPIITSHWSNQEAIAFERERLGRLIRHEETSADPQSLNAAIAERVDSGLFLEGETDALIAAKLQERMTAFLSGRRVNVRATRTVNGTPIAGFRRLGIELEMSLRMTELRALLVEIAGQSPKVMVSSLAVQAITPNNAETRDTVDVKMKLIGAVRDPRP